MNRPYCVYEHVFPNGKKYIGISCDAEKRWQNGNGYKTQRKIANAIKHYGWENVEHNIIVDGVTKEQAETLERYLVAELDTIKNGYNATIGGNTVGGAYLSAYVLAMLCYCKRWETLDELPIVQIVRKAKYDKAAADFWNEAANAVTIKHGKYSTTDFRQVDAFWFCMTNYAMLHAAKMKGEDVSNWQEPPVMEEGHAHE